MSRYELLSVAQGAKEIGRARWFMYKLIKEKKIAVYKIGGGLAISRVDLDEYVRRARIAPLGERKARKQTAEAAQ
jgi:excisionase family DNA binding protein